MGDARNIVERALNAMQDVTDELYGDDCEFISPGGTLRGREAIRGVRATFARAFPDSRIAVTNAVESGDWVTVEHVWTATQTGPLASPSGEVPPTNKTVRLRSCLVAQVRDGKIRAWHVYFDQVDFLSQLGLAGAAG